MGVKFWASSINWGGGGVIFGYTHFRGGVHFSSAFAGEKITIHWYNPMEYGVMT